MIPLYQFYKEYSYSFHQQLLHYIFEPAKIKLSYDELVVAAENVKASSSITESEEYIIIEEDIYSWYKLGTSYVQCIYRAGRVTVSNYNIKATVYTDANNPSNHLKENMLPRGL